jgi:hypothetical protein
MLGDHEAANPVTAEEYGGGRAGRPRAYNQYISFHGANSSSHKAQKKHPGVRVLSPGSLPATLEKSILILGADMHHAVNAPHTVISAPLT